MEEYQETTRDEEFELMDLILCPIFKTILNTYSRGIKQLLINHQSKYMPTKFRRELHSRWKPSTILNFETIRTLRTMTLLGSTTMRIIKDKNGKKVPQLEITEVVLVHCNIVNSQYSMIQELCLRLFQISHSVSY